MSAARKKTFRRWPSGKPSTLFNVAAALCVATERVVVVEGEFDVLALQQVGIANVVSVPDGTGSRLNTSLLAPLDGVARIVIATDQDGPGEELAQKLAEVLGRERCVRAVFGEYKDANDAVAAGWTVEQCEAAIAAATSMAAAGPGTASAGDWTQPVPLFDHDLPAFPLEALPDWLASFIDDVATFTQTPVDLAALLALGVFGMGAAKKARITIKEGYSEPLNLFVVVSLAPGNRKSQVMSILMNPVYAHERAAQAAAKAEIGLAEMERELVEGRLKQAQKAAIKADGEERAAAEEQARALLGQLNETASPALPRYTSDDITAEKLASLLAAQDGRIGVVSAEGGPFEVMAGRYSSNGGTNFEIYLKGHAGDPLRVDRVNREFEAVDSPALSVVLAVQPNVIRSIASNSTFKGRGLLARFLYALPTSPLGSRDVNPPPIAAARAEEYTNRLTRLLDVPLQREEGEVVEREIVLDPEASSEWLGFSAWLEPQLSPNGELGNMTDWAGKLAGAVARIAGILHMIDPTSGAEPWARPVTGPTMRRAIAIGKYLIPHAQAGYAEMGADGSLDDARYVWTWVARHELQSFVARDAFNDLRGRFKKMDHLRAALEILQDHGFVREGPAPSKRGRGRPRGPTYLVNPLAIVAGEAAVATNSAETAEFAGPDAEMNAADVELADTEVFEL